MKKTLPTLSTLCIAISSCLSFSSLAALPTSQDQLAQQIEKIEALQKEYQEQLEQLKQLKDNYTKNVNEAPEEQDKSYDSLKALVDRITLSGFFRAKYDRDDAEPVGADSNNKHFYLDLVAKMKVSDDWDANFESETRKGYTVNQTWRKGDTTSSDQDGTVQRIWVEGTPADLQITMGTKWWGLGFQALPFGHAADGISVGYDVLTDWNTQAFWIRPRGDLVTMPNGTKTQISGLNVTGSILDTLQTSLTFATNQNHGDDQKMSRMGAFELQYQATDDILLRGSFVKTNADDFNTSQEYRIDYKETDLDKVGSYSLYTRYIDFELYGDYSHDDEWNSLPADAQGWVFGAKYVLFHNVVWETFYSTQKRNQASTDHHDAHRDLFRTQIDFHF